MQIASEICILYTYWTPCIQYGINNWILDQWDLIGANPIEKFENIWNAYACGKCSSAGPFSWTDCSWTWQAPPCTIVHCNILHNV
jgi:hypothetical protein